ncbi:MAG: UbiA family prenyltransferase [Planctomycetia bacterium]|nr:UbiA family prenyltransferase [Planctomycetia bacterium]
MDILRLIRVKHWVKNVFVIFPLFFSGELLDGDVSSDIFRASLAFLSFCLWSSAIYVLNDIVDVERDRAHPRKQNRPIASGQVSVWTASFLGVALFVLPFLVMGLVLQNVCDARDKFFLCGILYGLNNLFYCFLLRSQVILDVFSISMGFILRILSGCFIILLVEISGAVRRWSYAPRLAKRRIKREF